MRFTATLEDRYVIVPFDVRAEWGEARPPVAGTINGVPFRTRLVVYGGQYVLGLTNAIRKQARRRAGRRGRDRDSSATTRRARSRSRRSWRRRSTGDVAARRSTRSRFTHRREYAKWIAEAKRAETRARRARAIEMLRERAQYARLNAAAAESVRSQLAGVFDPGVGVVLVGER